MEFTAFTGQPNPTRFETTGKVLEKNLLQARDAGDSRVYPHQINSVFGVKAKLAENVKEKINDPVLVVAPTGSGKSGIITLLPYILQCRKALILTPSHIISEQLGKNFGIFDEDDTFFEKIGICPSRDARRNFMEIGVILSKSVEVFKSVHNLVIVTAQKFTGNSLASLTKESKNKVEEKTVVKKVKNFFGQFDTLIVDEAHHYPAPTWTEIEKTFRESSGTTKQLIFLTATPVRKFKGKLINILPTQRIACTITREELEGEYIRPLRFKLEKKENDIFSHIKSILEDENFLDFRFCKPKRSRKPQAMILVTERKEADKLANDLNLKARNQKFAISIHRGEANAEQKTENFTNGEYQVAVSCGLLLEGYDNAAVTLCVILRGTDSKVVFSQFVGRCMRLMKFDQGPKDKTIGTILSYPKYKQKKMFDEMDEMAKLSPVETKIDDETANTNNQPGPSRPIQQSVGKRNQGTSQNDSKRRRQR